MRNKRKMMTSSRNSLFWLACFHAYLLAGLTLAASFKTFRSLFSRIQDSHLTAIPNIVLQNTTVEICARSCVRESSFECKSFDFDNIDRSCRLHNVTHEQAMLSQTEYIDHYRTSYVKLFQRVAKHVVTLKHNLKLPGSSVEQCARRCVLQVTFKCRGFDYEFHLRNCWLTEETAHTSGGVQLFGDADFYERIPEGPLADFINYGSGTLRRLEGVQLYQKIMLGVSLEACAQLCMSESAFKCLSFDYMFADHSCCLSEFIAANVHGMSETYSTTVRVMHFELKEHFLYYFYATPYAVVLGNNEKSITRVTPERCARNCLEAVEFICRSFDYQIQDGTCLLSSKTGSDVGGLYNQGLAEIHHFEMKPILDCGGYLADSSGNFASPNWPRDYSPNMHCEWNIQLPKHKVGHFKFTHFDLGRVTGDLCDQRNDQLIFEEYINGDRVTFCAQPHTNKIVSKTNNVTVTFLTNARYDANGFRVFFKADWTCDTVLTEDHGEFASPHWPNHYDASTDCYWIIRAPERAQILLRFTGIELESHHGMGNCNERFDRIKVHDGGTRTSRILDMYCGKKPPISLRSSGNQMYVEFKSDERVQHPGFHAAYKFLFPAVPTASNSPHRGDGSSVITPRTHILRKTTTSSANAPFYPKLRSTRLPTLRWVSTSGHQTTTIRARMKTKEIINKVDNKSYHKPKDRSRTLTAEFGEPTHSPKRRITLKTRHGNASAENGHHVPADSLPNHDISHDSYHVFHTTMWAIAASLSLLLAIVILSLLFVCRYYRKRVPKRRRAPNFPFSPEENLHLYEKDNRLNTLNARNVNDNNVSSCIVEDDRPGLANTYTTPPGSSGLLSIRRDVAFANPVYEARNSNTLNTFKKEKDLDAESKVSTPP